MPTQEQTFPMTNCYGTFQTQEDWDRFCKNMADYYTYNKYTGD